MTNNNHRETWHGKQESERTYGQRVADHVAAAVGSWGFIVFQTVFIFAWVSANIYGYVEQWDPFPFILMNLLFSAQAAYTAPIIMMSQRRQNERDRAQALADFETNVAAKKEIEMLHRRLDAIEREKLDAILQMVKKY